MSKLAFRAVVLGAVIAVLGIASYAIAGGAKHNLKEETLTGYEENPDLSTTGQGSFEGKIAKDDSSLNYTLTYSNLESNITQAHIHFGKTALNGGISVWLCKTASASPTPPNVPAHDPPVCPAGTSGDVSGTLFPGDVVGPAGQGIAAGEFAELLAAIRAGHTYANVHTVSRGGGEIRAQIDDDKGKDD